MFMVNCTFFSSEGEIKILSKQKQFKSNWSLNQLNYELIRQTDDSIKNRINSFLGKYCNGPRFWNSVYTWYNGKQRQH